MLSSSSEVGEGEAMRNRRSFSAGPPSDSDEAALARRKSSLSAEVLDFDAEDDKEVMIRGSERLLY